jgi:predicted nucleic acid-binding protein
LFVDVENICVVSGESYFSIQASSSHYQALLNDLEAAVWISSFTVWTIGDRALFRTWSGTSVRLSQMRQFLEPYEVVPQSLVTTTEAVLMHFQCRSLGRQKQLEIKDIDLLISRAELGCQKQPELSVRSPVLHVGSPSYISIYHESGNSDQNSLPRKDLQSAKIMIPVPSPQVIFMR